MADKGIAITPNGFRASVRIHGQLHQRRFPTGTDILTIRTWLLKTEMKFRKGGRRATGSFADDAARYLESVSSMPTFEQRKQHVDEWTAVFEHRRRDELAASEIAAQLHTWRATMSAASVNKRRTALMHMFSVLDGKAERNPVRDTPKFAEPRPTARALPYRLIRRIFAAMPSSKSKARLMVIAYTGIPHAQLRAIIDANIDFTNGTVALEGRKKGKGTDARVMPLTKDAIRAFKLMKREEAWGDFSRATLRTVFRRACKRALGTDEFRPYDLRHSFGTEVYRKSGDIRATQILMGHSTERLTHRYTLAAIDPRLVEAIRGFGQAKVAAPVVSRRRSLKKPKKSHALSRR